jgi:hypothetical protein
MVFDILRYQDSKVITFSKVLSIGELSLFQKSLRDDLRKKKRPIFLVSFFFRRTILLFRNSSGFLKSLGGQLSVPHPQTIKFNKLRTHLRAEMDYGVQAHDTLFSN